MNIQDYQFVKYHEIEEDSLQSFFMSWVTNSLYDGEISIKDASKALSVYAAAAATAIRN